MNTEPLSQLVDSTPLLNNREALLKRADEDGYLFFKQLVPKSEVLAVRRDLLGVIDASGWRKPGEEPLSGTIDLEALNRIPAEQMRLDIGVSIEAYNAAQKLESVHRLPHHKALIDLYRTLFDSDVLVHPRHIIRMITAHHGMTPTPPHQDFPLIQGTTQTWTCWLPVGDCPRELGGLAVLKGSHKHGYIPITNAAGAGGMAVQLCPNDGDGWTTIDYEAGDVLTFPSLTVHRGTRCQYKDQVRLSMDIRFQSTSEVIEERSLKPHCDLSWEDIYAGWKNDDLKYYWLKSAPTLSPWDQSLHQPQRRIC
jgi:hypothetical protein